MSTKLDGKIGETDPICPYCKTVLDKMPGAKKKCPNCANFIYVRTRPFDRKKILIREDQITDVEEEWRLNSVLEEIEQAKDQDYYRVEADLRKKWGFQPSLKDIVWTWGMQKAMVHATNLDWGLYRNEKLYTAQRLDGLKDNRRSFHLYLEICYIDLNGPENRGGMPRDMLNDYPMWDLQFAELSPGVISPMKVLIIRLGYSMIEVETEFMEIADANHRHIKLPVAPASAWKSLKSELEKQE